MVLVFEQPNIEKTTPEMNEKVRELTENIDDRHEKIKTIFQFVSQKIRYLGLTYEKNSPGYEPHPVNMTFERRAGVCRDKAALLVAMLRLAGFEAYPVLIMSGPKKDPEVPHPWFNHAIVCVREPDGSYMLMDPTDENTKQLFPAYLNNQSYIVATPEGENLQTSPVEPAGKNMMRIFTQGVLDDEGNLAAESTLCFDGINDNAYRGYFAMCSREEKRGYFERLAQKIAPGARLASYKILPENMLDTDQPLKAHFTFETGDIRIPGENAVMLPVLCIGKNVGMIHHLIGEMGLKERRYPIFTRFACGVEETIKLDLKRSVGKPLSLPEYESVNNDGAAWSRNLSYNDNRLVIKNIFKMKLPEYLPDQYQSFKKTLEIIESNNRKMPIFTEYAKKANIDEKKWYSGFQPDSVVLNEEVEYALADETKWTETRRMKIKVLTYAGMKKNSDIIIGYNPAWEKVEIKKAVVISKDGKIQTVDTKEINVMDADWVGSAPRYPSSKLLALSLPGVEKGSIIEYTIVRKKKDRPFFSIGGEFFYNDRLTEGRPNMGNRTFSIDGVFRYYDPIEKKRVILKIPAGLSLKIFKADHGMGQEKICKRKSKHIIKEKVCQVVNQAKDGKTVKEFTAAMVAPVKYENNLPPWYSFNPVLFVSSGSWRQYAGQMQQVLLKAALSGLNTKDRTNALLADVEAGTPKIKAIRDFVAKYIKLIDIPLSELPIDYITPADKTLDDGYGNCADRAVLLYAMLSAAGFGPEFVLSSWVSPVKSLQRPLMEYPAPQWFDNVLVRVKTDIGYIYLNDTDQYARLGSTPNHGHPCLSLQSGQIETIKAAKEDLKDRYDVTFSVSLNSNGSATIKKTRKLYGKYFALFCKKFSEMPPEKRRRHHQELTASISRGARPTGEYITDFHVYPGVETFSVHVDNYATRQRDYLYLKLPGLIGGIGGVDRDRREYPLYRSRSAENLVRVEVKLPDGIESLMVVPPEKLTFLIKRLGEISMKTGLSPSGSVDCRCLNVRQDINLNPAVILPDEYPQILEAHRILGHPKTKMLMFKMKKDD